MRGGGRTRSGPAPDPMALRRERKSDSAGWTTLPTEGRQGDPPAWPLLAPSGRETELWADLWAKPQAIMWERLGCVYEVALLVRNLARAEEPDAVVALAVLVRQFGDSLGLSAAGMLRNRWRIGPANALAAAQKAAAPRRPSVRDRLKVVLDESAAEQ